MRYAYRFILQILATIALVFITLHGQAIWHNIPEYGFIGAIRMEFEVAGLIITVAIAIVIWAGIISVRDQKRKDNESAKLLDLMGKIAKKFGVDDDDKTTKND